jgi:CRISPR-associated endoribonuclease Cas6
LKPWRSAEDEAPFDFQLLNKPKSKLVTVKAGTPQETKIRGYLFAFKLKADLRARRLRFLFNLKE